jgi:hypothetical protein
LRWVLTDIEALRMVDEAYADRTEWVKKSIRTTAKVRFARFFFSSFSMMFLD